MDNGTIAFICTYTFLAVCTTGLGFILGVCHGMEIAQRRQRRALDSPDVTE